MSYSSLFSEDYLVKYSKRYDVNSTKTYNDHIKAHKHALQEYKNEIQKVWGNVEISTATKLVEYTNNYRYKKVIDYKKNKVILEVLVKNNKLAHKHIILLFDNLYNYTQKQIYKNSILRKKKYKILNIFEEIILNDNIKLLHLVQKERKQEILADLSLKKYDVRQYNNKYIYTTTVNLPNNYHKIIKLDYLSIINDISIKLDIPRDLITAIIENRTYFNQNAIDEKPSYGLMQVNLLTAMKVYYHLYGYKKFISPMHLYDTYTNILYGSTYLNILFSTNFKDIRNYKSKLYLIILAYYMNSADTFSLFAKDKKVALKKINLMSSSNVYKYILKKVRNKHFRISFSKIVKQLKIL
jgi:membrane-bound lytic murein transglycosylase C